MKTVVGMYNRFEDAQHVVQGLHDAGFSKEDINLIARDERGEYSRSLGDQAKTQNVKEGAATGAVLGGLGGLLLGLGALAIPGIGPVIAAGPIVTTLAGAGVGAAAGGLVGGLVNLGVPEDQANLYAEGIRRGGTLVVVRTQDADADRAADVMNRYNPIDVRRESETWKTKQKWSRFDETAQPMDADVIEADRTRIDQEAIPVTGEAPDMTIPVVEEDIRVGKRDVEKGGVRINTYTHEEPVEEQVNLRKEHVDVERRPVDRPATDADFEAFKEGTMEVKETDEEAVVQKEARVVEEVHVRKDAEQTTETVRDTVRRTGVDVERLGADWKKHEPRFQENFRTTYSKSGHDYTYYQPAYAFGYEMANDPRYQGYDWNRFEPVARQEWVRSGHQTAWDDIKDAVRNAWESIKH